MTSVCALYSYQANESDELSFYKNDVLEILEKNDDDWWLAKKGDEIGMIPSNYIYVTHVRSPRDKPSPNGGDKLRKLNDSNSPQKWTKHQTTSSSSSSSSLHNISPLRTSSTSNSTDLRRLKELREEADRKIGALRFALFNFHLLIFFFLFHFLFNQIYCMIKHIT